MSAKFLKIDQLKLDVINPRISQASDQREAMQRIIEDQDQKLANLAESIANEGLNPMDRLLVTKSEEGDQMYTVLEGNRRALALKILKNPAIVASLDVRPALRKRFESLAQSFSAEDVEPIPCFEVANRADGSTWIEQRHNGEDEGRGIVNWSGVASSRFRGRDPALQAFDFVRQHGKLTEPEKEILDERRFPITTLDRLLSTPSVRATLGFDIKDDKLITELPPDEAMKPLKRVVLDLAERKINVTNLKRKNQQLDYVSGLAAADAPDLSKKTGKTCPIDEFGEHEFSPAKPPAKKVRIGGTAQRHTVVPRGNRLKIVNAKIAEIYKELRSLRLDQHPHAIAVLLRVFLETSVDHYLNKAGVPLTFPTGAGDKDKSLKKKIEEAVEHMVKNGATKRDFAGVMKGLSDKSHPFSVELLHAYVHNRFLSPMERDLTAAWDNAQPFFERIWP